MFRMSVSGAVQSVLLPEHNGTGFGIHAVHDGQGLYVIAQITDDTATNLEALLNDNAAAFHDGTGGLGDGDHPANGCHE